MGKRGPLRKGMDGQGGPQQIDELDSLMNVATYEKFVQEEEEKGAH